MSCSLDARHEFLRKYGVPEGWVAKQLHDLADIVGGGTPSRDDHRYWGGSIPWATPTDLTANDARFLCKTEECITDAGLSSSAATLLPEGSILYTSRATIGAKAIATVPIATNQGFASLTPRSVNGLYLFYLLDMLAPGIKRLGAGTTFLEVSKRDVKRVWCSLPIDLGEQSSIAQLIDAVDSGIETIQQVITSAKRLKQAVIQQFFFSALGETAYADRPSKSLPPKWKLLPTSLLLAEEPKNGISPPSSSQAPGTPTFSICAIRGGFIDLADSDNLKFAQLREKVARSYRVRRGDILIVRGNANPDLVGKAGMIDTFPPGCIYPDITKRVVFRDACEDKILPEYAVLVWNHSIVHNQILRRAKTSNGTLKINSRDVKQIVVPVPPEGEQITLVRLAAAIQAKIDQLTNVVNAKKSLRSALVHDLLTGRKRISNLNLLSNYAVTE